MDGGKYTGGFVNGARDGKGKLIFTDGAFYEGDFAKGEICGYGVY